MRRGWIEMVRSSAVGSLLVAGALVLSACSSGSPDSPVTDPVSEEAPTTEEAPAEEPTTEEAEPTTEAPITEAADDAAERDYGNSAVNDRGNLLKTVDQWAGIAMPDGTTGVVDFRITEIDGDYQCDGQPASDRFVALRFEVETYPELADADYPFFYVDNVTSFTAWTADGKRVNDVAGNGFMCLAAAEQLPHTINPAESAEGLIVLDLPSDATSIGYTDYSDQNTWEWELPEHEA